MSTDREESVYVAKLAEQAERCAGTGQGPGPAQGGQGHGLAALTAAGRRSGQQQRRGRQFASRAADLCCCVVPNPPAPTACVPARMPGMTRWWRR
jgi:hypothetical protein